MMLKDEHQFEDKAFLLLRKARLVIQSDWLVKKNVSEQSIAAQPGPG